MTAAETVNPTPSTKACRCGSTSLVEMPSLDLKHCAECGQSIVWPLERGQKPLHGHHRSGRTSKEIQP